MAISKTLVVLLGVVHFVWMCEGREFNVFDSKASWQIPSSPDAFTKWAQINRFQIGDSIVLKYDGKQDSVLEVSEADYKSCSRLNPIKSHNDGNTKITLERSGPFFFISGADGHCDKGQKLQLTVLSATHHHHHHDAAAPAPSPTDSNNHHHGHAPAPAPAHNDGGASLRVGVVVSAAAAALIVALV